MTALKQPRGTWGLLKDLSQEVLAIANGIIKERDWKTVKRRTKGPKPPGAQRTTWTGVEESPWEGVGKSFYKTSPLGRQGHQSA